MGKSSYILSEKAAFINDMNIKRWIYLELLKLNNLFVWGCDECQDMKTFRALETTQRDWLSRTAFMHRLHASFGIHTFFFIRTSSLNFGDILRTVS